MITSAQSWLVQLEPQVESAATVPVPSPGRDLGGASEEYALWAEVLLRAVDDFKTYTAHRADPDGNPVSKKSLRSILADGCDPEYWFFGDKTGFDAVCMALNVEPDVIRGYLRSWMQAELGEQPTY